ncbi:MAG: ribonuclease E inhibitor RraB [Sulfurimonas sp.]|nr:ribonuclease E inhibitor RraB [Sulfurimonas sp.]MDQ7062251.1 ribonuclease E inhibitor RraB [Sulfurimonas sp.]
MREIFTKIQDDELLSIEIETDASQYKDEYSWLFSVFVKYDAKDKATLKYEEFLEIKESLIIAVEYEGKAKYIGSRIIDGWSEFYFCASSAKELNPLVTSMLKDTGYAYESNIIKDRKWNFYETVLFPTELEQIHMQSEKIIFLLQEEEDDVSISRDVEHYVSFTTPTQKDKFLVALNLEGFSYKDDISNEEFENGVALIKNHSVSSKVVEEIINALFVIIKEHHGYYEGWSTSLA